MKKVNMYKKVVLFLLAAIVIVGGMSGCSKEEESNQTIKIGSVHPLTGNYAYEAQAIVNAQKLAIDEINEAGGIKSLGGKKLELVTGDSQGAADVGASETERLIEEGVIALTGAFQSGVVTTTSQITEQAGIPYVVTVGNNVAMFERDFNYLYRIQPNAKVFVENFIEYLNVVKTDDIKTAVIIHEDSMTGTDSSDIIEENIASTGIELLGVISYTASAASLSAEVTKLAEYSPDMVICIGYYSDTSLLTKEINERDIKFKLITGVANGGISDAKYIKEFGNKVENYIDCNYSFNPNSEKTQQLLSTYKEKYNDDMSVHAVWGYESIKLLADALERSESSDPEKLNETLKSTFYTGHTLAFEGPIEFDEKGENINAAGVLVQIQDGEHVIVFPEAFKESDIKLGE